MLLPTKTLSPSRSLIGVGAVILRLLSEPKPVSRVWDEYKHAQERVPNSATVTFSWFVLALDLLFALGLIRWPALLGWGLGGFGRKGSWTRSSSAPSGRSIAAAAATGSTTCGLC